METLFDYRISEKIFEGSLSKIYRGVLNTGELPCIIKTVNRGHGKDNPVESLKHEYLILRRFKSKGIVSPIGLTPTKKGLAMITRDIGGVDLQQLYKQSGLSEEHFLKIGVQITAAVIDIHREQILHNNISLANIVLNRANGRLNIIDFADA
ncbi:MAG: protein kinase, partial [Desulfobacterales bacterium]|nr:protein kinase [Desulfobacterales bacterium]